VVEADLALHLVRRLLVRSCYQLQLQHYTTATTCRIMNVTPVLRLAVDSDVMRQSVLDLVPALSIPPGHALIHANQVG
jgi:hypothetical protein